jgi:hypothetical protein
VRSAVCGPSMERRTGGPGIDIAWMSTPGPRAASSYEVWAGVRSGAGTMRMYGLGDCQPSG